MEKPSTSSSPSNDEPPTELFQTNYVSAMLVIDGDTVVKERLLPFCGTDWRSEWNRGVQVPVNPTPSKTIPWRRLPTKGRNKRLLFKPKNHVRGPGDVAELAYDVDEMDDRWLVIANSVRNSKGLDPITHDQFEKMYAKLEYVAFIGATEGGTTGGEDDDAACDVCLSLFGEDGNELVFCDRCNVCVHQACYGIVQLPNGPWFCRPCAVGLRPSCIFCPNKGGAMKSTRSSERWGHVSCAMWIPEVNFESQDLVEPIINVAKIPEERWLLQCYLCEQKMGACIQCNQPKCRRSYHVTCAQKNGLRMTLTPDKKGVVFESFCDKHAPATHASCVPHLDNDSAVDDDEQMVTASASVSGTEDISLKMSPSVLDSSLTSSLPKGAASVIFHYWRMKRLQYSRYIPLRFPKRKQKTKSAASQPVEANELESLMARVRRFRMLRQNLEKARNLCYLVERREKLKRSYVCAACSEFGTLAEHIRQCQAKNMKLDLQLPNELNYADLYFMDPINRPVKYLRKRPNRSGQFDNNFYLAEQQQEMNHQRKRCCILGCCSGAAESVAARSTVPAHLCNDFVHFACLQAPSWKP